MPFQDRQPAQDLVDAAFHVRHVVQQEVVFDAGKVVQDPR
jgi:hypothetical protein